MPIFGPTLLLLALNLFVLWAASGVIRARSKTTPNREDAEAFAARGVKLMELDPPAVQRALRAHANAMAITVPFAMLCAIFVAAGGLQQLASTGDLGPLPGAAALDPSSPLISRTFLRVLCGTHVVGRLLHGPFYILEKQPWRTIAFAMSALTTLLMFALDGWLLWLRS
jgi:uncharacterized MAPEG superfamily protein